MGFTNPILWTFLPTALVLDVIDAIDAKLVIYYFIDNFAASSPQAKKIKNIISREKGKFTHLVDYPEGKQASYGASAIEKIVAQVWGFYETRKTKENSLDFDDLLLKAVKLLKENTTTFRRTSFI